jgi:hypothetical protein
VQLVPALGRVLRGDPDYDVELVLTFPLSLSERLVMTQVSRVDAADLLVNIKTTCNRLVAGIRSDRAEPA